MITFTKIGYGHIVIHALIRHKMSIHTIAYFMLIPTAVLYLHLLSLARI